MTEAEKYPNRPQPMTPEQLSERRAGRPGSMPSMIERIAEGADISRQQLVYLIAVLDTLTRIEQALEVLASKIDNRSER